MAFSRHLHRSAAVLAIAVTSLSACTCGTDAQTRQYLCQNDGQCAAGFFCVGSPGVCLDHKPTTSPDGGCIDICLHGSVCLSGGCMCVGPSAQPSETQCNDGVDNDCDGMTDCQDSTCDSQVCGTGRTCQATNCACAGNGGTPQLAEIICDDGHDNDCDGMTDCGELGCDALPCGPFGSNCETGVCECGGNGGARETVETSCSDGHDNDCDGQADSNDSDCAPMCNSQISTAVASVGGRGRLLELSGRPRAIFEGNGVGSAVQYTECTAACTSSSATWSTVSLGSSVDLGYCRAELTAVGTTLYGAWRSGTDLIYAECPSNCTSASSWSQGAATPIGLVAGRATLGFVVAPPLRAIIFEGVDAGAAYAECTTTPCTSGSNWSRVGFAVDPLGGSLALSSNGTRMAIFGSNGAPEPMLYAECASNCTSPASWATASIAPGSVPDVVADSQGLPRIFFSPNAPGAAGSGGTQLTRCTVRPCTNPSNWVTTTLSLADGYVSAGVAPDGGTYFITNAAGSTLTVGTQAADGGYMVRTLVDCAGSSANLTGVFPVGYLSGTGNARVLYSGPASPYGPMRFFYEAP